MLIYVCNTGVPGYSDIGPVCNVTPSLQLYLEEGTIETFIKHLMSNSRSSIPSSGNIVLHLDTANYVIAWLGCSSSLYTPLPPAVMTEKKLIVANFKRQIKAERPRSKENWSDLEAQGKWLSLTNCHKLLETGAAILASQRAASSSLNATESIAQKHLALSFYASIPPSRGLSVRGVVVVTTDRHPIKGKEAATIFKVGDVFKLCCFPKTYASSGLETTLLPPALGQTIQEFLDREWKASNNPGRFLFVKPGSGAGYASDEWATLLKSATSIFSKGRFSVSVNKLRAAYVTHQEGDANAGSSVKEASAKAMMHSRSTAVKTYARLTPREQKALGMEYAISVSDKRRHVLVKQGHHFKPALVFANAPLHLVASSSSPQHNSPASVLAMFYSTSHHSGSLLVCRLQRNSIFVIDACSVVGDLQMRFDESQYALTTSEAEIKCAVLGSRVHISVGKKHHRPALEVDRAHLVASAGDHVMVKGARLAQLLNECDFSKPGLDLVAVQFFQPVGIKGNCFLPGSETSKCHRKDIGWPVDSVFDGHTSPAGWRLCEEIGSSMSVLLTAEGIQLAQTPNISANLHPSLGAAHETASGSSTIEPPSPSKDMNYTGDDGSCLPGEVAPEGFACCDDVDHCGIKDIGSNNSETPIVNLNVGRPSDFKLGKRLWRPGHNCSEEASQFTQADLNYLSTGVATNGKRWGKILAEYPFQKGLTRELLRAKWRVMEKRLAKVNTPERK